MSIRLPCDVLDSRFREKDGLGQDFTLEKDFAIVPFDDVPFSLFRLSLRNNGYLAVFTKSDAFRADALSFRQGNVNDASVGGGHGLQGDAPTGLNDPLGHLVGHIP